MSPLSCWLHSITKNSYCTSKTWNAGYKTWRFTWRSWSMRTIPYLTTSLTSSTPRSTQRISKLWINPQLPWAIIISTTPWIIKRSQAPSLTRKRKTTLTKILKPLRLLTELARRPKGRLTISFRSWRQTIVASCKSSRTSNCSARNIKHRLKTWSRHLKSSNRF